MIRRFCTNVANKWPNFIVKNKDGGVTKLCIIDVPIELKDEFVEFNINNYVKRELIYEAAGIHNNINALSECREIIKSNFDNKLYGSVICCPEVNGMIVPDIVASVTLKFFNKSDQIYYEPPAKTKEIEKLYVMERNLYKLYSIPRLLNQYDAEVAFDFVALSIRPDFIGKGITNEIGRLRPIWHKTRDNAIYFAWSTAEGTQKAMVKYGWEIIYKISSDELENIWNVRFNNPPRFIALMACR